jgi:O-antigen/teichoic acid export membrane protein
MSDSRTSKVIALSLGQAFATGAGIISGIIAARLLTKLDYATLKQTMLAYNFALPIMTLGIPSALYYFLPREENRKKGLVLDNMIILALLGAIFTLFLILGGNKLLAMRFNNPMLVNSLSWMLLYPIYTVPAAILSVVLLTQSKVMLLTKYNVISTLTLVILTIAGTVITRSYNGPLLVQIIFPAVLCPIILYIIFKSLPGKISFPSFKSMKGMVKYGVPFGLASMLGILMLESNKIVVASICSPEDFATYVNGAIEIPLVGVITGSITSVILVDMTKFCQQNQYNLAIDLFRKAAVKSAIILLPVMFFLLFCGKPFIVSLYSEKYLASVVPFYIFLFVLPIRIVNYGSALLSLGKPNLILFRSVFDLVVNTVLSILFIYLFGYLGAAVATVITLYAWTTPYNLFQISRGFNIPINKTLPFKDIGKICLISILSLLILVPVFLIPSKLYFVILLTSAILYFPTVAGLLIHYKYIEIPPKYIHFIPAFLVRNSD